MKSSVLPADISRRAPTLTMLAVAATAILTVLAPASASASNSSSKCANVIIIGVRGTNEGAGVPGGDRTYAWGGMGSTASAATKVQQAVSVPVRRVGLKYPASGDYFASLREGITNLRAELNDLAVKCPLSRTVLIGYSQGAHVIGDVLAKDTSPQISSAAKSKIKAVVFFGDPSFNPFEPFDFGGGWRFGMFWRAPGQLKAFGSQLRSYCLPFDAYCQSSYPIGQDVHESYRQDKWQTAAANFICDRL